MFPCFFLKTQLFHSTFCVPSSRDVFASQELRGDKSQELGGGPVQCSDIFREGPKDSKDPKDAPYYAHTTPMFESLKIWGNSIGKLTIRGSSCPWESLVNHP